MPIDPQAALFAAQSLALKQNNTDKVLQLLIDEDCTIPFISRYRKEATGGLDEVQVGAILEAYNGYIEREKRRQFILESITAQDKLTPELAAKIHAAETLHQLEDYYAPYKNKRKTKGQLAIAAGLQPLADLIKSTHLTMPEIMQKHADEYLNAAANLHNLEEVLEGVKAIIAEEIAHDTDLKEVLRQDFWRQAVLKSEKRKDGEKIKDAQKFKDYYAFEQKIKDLKSAKVGHRFLAMRRGMTLKILKVSVCYPEEVALATITKKTFDLPQLGAASFLAECIKRAYSTAIYPSLDLEIKSVLKLLSDESAIDVFGVNLKNLLLQPYLGQQAVIGIDPGIRTGCKVAVIDKNGAFLVDTVIYPHEPRNDIQGAQAALENCIEKLKVKNIAIGNGTYGRETLQFIQKHVKQVKNREVTAMLVNEDGASIYSASEIARKEFPDKDLTVRGAISIARRFQDPLAELVKIDPKSIGVGQYQHDVNQSKLKKSLVGIVENCVNFVGVDVNTASAPLLSYISGIGPTLAENIVKYRSKISGFKNRQELLDIPRFSAKIFEQSAGFLRIYGAKNPIDGTFIHPERYSVLEDWCHKKNISSAELIGNKDQVTQLKNDFSLQELVGKFTLDDIVAALLSPSQDPRTEFTSFEYRTDISTIKDLKINQYYPGIVTNITHFGAFVDIGIKENGLIHVAQIADKFVANAMDILQVGQAVKARVLEVDLERKRISLSLKSERPGERAGQTRRHQESPSAGAKKPQRKPAEKFSSNAFAALKEFKIK